MSRKKHQHHQPPKAQPPKAQPPKAQLLEEPSDSSIKPKDIDWKKLILEILIGLVIGLSMLYIGNIFEPGKQPFYSYYFKIKVIDSPKSNDNLAKTTTLKEMLSIVIRSDKTFAAKSVYIYRVKAVLDVKIFSSNQEINKNIMSSIKWDHDLKSGLISIINFPSIPSDSKLIINISGTFDDDYDETAPMIETMEGGKIWPTKSYLVDGVWLFIGRYWSIVMGLNLFIIAWIYYFFKRRYNVYGAK